MGDAIWEDILIVIATAVLTYFVNRLTIVGEIKKEKENKINEYRLPLYTKCFEILDLNIANNNVVFQREYIDKLVEIKSKMKLIASSKVLQEFKVYYKWVVNNYESYLDFCANNDPTNKVHMEKTPDGTEYEVADFNDHDLKYYEFLQNKYISDRDIKITTVKSKIQGILDAMRYDFKNDKFIDDF